MTGEVRWNGRLIQNPAEFFTPPRSAYTPQVPRLFSDTLQENLLLGLNESQTDIPIRHSFSRDGTRCQPN